MQSISRRVSRLASHDFDRLVLNEDTAEILAMISLKKFRHLRRAYHPHEGPR